MGLTVSDNLKDVIKNGECLTDFDFNFGNENILYLTDEEGNESRVRISAALRDLLIEFAYIHSEKKAIAA